jgi:hypothetical protein
MPHLQPPPTTPACLLCEHSDTKQQAAYEQWLKHRKQKDNTPSRTHGHDHAPDYEGKHNLDRGCDKPDESLGPGTSQLLLNNWDLERVANIRFSEGASAAKNLVRTIS